MVRCLAFLLVFISSQSHAALEIKFYNVGQGEATLVSCDNAQGGKNRMLVVNPVTDPITDMQQFLGDRYSEKCQLNYHISDQDLLNYSKMNILINPKTKSLVFLTEDDPVIDHKSALQKYSGNKNSQIIIRKTGGHSLQLSDLLYLSVLKVFLETE